jgi:integrase
MTPRTRGLVAHYEIGRLDRHLVKRHPGCPYIFHRDGKKVGRFRKSFRTACLLAGIVPGRAGKTIHDFRRTGVANLIHSGCDERTAMLLSGHKTLSMLARYNIRRREAVRQALQRLEEYVEAMPTVGPVEPQATEIWSRVVDCTEGRARSGSAGW